MNAREIVDHIRTGGPAELVLREEPLRFRRRMRSSPCNINEILQALQSSETIRSVKCYSHLDLSISVVDEWIQLIKTLMSIEGIQRLELNCVNGCRDFHPLQAIADAVNNAHSLQSLSVLPLD
jgi:hypothetical protein